MNPRVAIDARMIGMGGIGRYTESLAVEMIRRRPEWKWILIGDGAALGRLADRSGIRSASDSIEIRECRARVYSAEEAFGMRHLFEDADLVHVPHFNAPFFIGPKLVATIHDLIHFDYPAYQPFPGANKLLDWKLRRLLRRADAVLTVSAAASAALQRRYPMPHLPFKLHVTWEAADSLFAPAQQKDDAERLRSLGIDPDPEQPIILCVGAIREHKDTMTLLEAYRALRAEHPERKVRLVLSGKLDPRFEAKHRFSSRMAQTTGAVHLSSAADQDLAALYRRAAVTVMPSRAEGFGLPAVEAMQSGSPLIISDAPALREVAGPAALVFPMGQIDALKEHLYNVLGDPSLRARLAGEGLERARSFRWTETASQTLDVYETVLNTR